MLLHRDPRLSLCKWLQSDSPKLGACPGASRLLRIVSHTGIQGEEEENLFCVRSLQTCRAQKGMIRDEIIFLKADQENQSNAV